MRRGEPHKVRPLMNQVLNRHMNLQLRFAQLSAPRRSGVARSILIF